MLEHVGAYDHRVPACRQPGLFDGTGIDGVIVGARMLGPQWMWLDCVDLYAIMLKQLPQKALRRADIQHGRAAYATNQLGDLLVTTLSIAVKCVVQDVVSIGCARRTGMSP